MVQQVNICSKCVMDTNDDPLIVFDDAGVCNYCHDYENISKQRMFSKIDLEQLIAEIKKNGKNKNYDCIIGVSGGVDSTYVAYIVKSLGLRPLAVHLDNGWDSELAVSNIENTIKTLKIDLHTHVINWEEFKDLQLSYLKASVVDIEAISDHAIFATLYKTASKEGIKYILTGENLATEGFLPQHWVHNKNDLMNIKGIHRKFGKIKLRTFPFLGLRRKWYYSKIRGIKAVPILNYIQYVKEDAKKLITQNLSWRDYGGKHHESLITRFYQSYILPQKFQVDKRKSHLSTLICSGQLSRNEALEELKKPLFNDEELKKDKDYVIKKFGLTENGFQEIMQQPVRKHTDYPSIMNWYHKLYKVFKVYRKIVPRKSN